MWKIKELAKWIFSTVLPSSFLFTQYLKLIEWDEAQPNIICHQIPFRFLLGTAKNNLIAIFAPLPRVLFLLLPLLPFDKLLSSTGERKASIL